MNIPSLPMGLSQRDLEPQDPEAEYERELDDADTEIDLERNKPTN